MKEKPGLYQEREGASFVTPFAVATIFGQIVLLLSSNLAANIRQRLDREMLRGVAVSPTNTVCNNAWRNLDILEMFASGFLSYNLFMLHSRTRSSKINN
jgi:hypothetical protein